MTNPGGGKNDIPNRLKRHFFIMNMLPPDNAIVQDIYGNMTNHKFKPEVFKDDKNAYENIKSICNATIEIWKTVKEKFIPTPMKFTYNFTMKDLSKIMLGIFRIDTPTMKNSKQLNNLLTKDVVVHLWRNEVTRVIADRFIEEADVEKYKNILYDVCTRNFKE